MNTREQMENELKEQLLASNNAGLYPSARLTELIQDAHFWATGLFQWRALVKGKTTTTQADLEYYDQPTDFRTGTVIRMEINGKEYNRKAFEDFLDYKLEYPTSNKRIFSLYERKIFVKPIPTETGLTMTIWGSVIADDLSASSSQTIFSGNNITGNEAIVRKAFSVAVRRVDPTLSKEEESAARLMLKELFDQENMGNQRDQRLNLSVFAVPDFFYGGEQTAIGKFSYDPEEDY